MSSSIGILISVIPYAKDGINAYKSFKRNRLMAEMNEELRKHTLVLDRMQISLMMENYSEYNFAWRQLSNLERPEISFEQYRNEIDKAQENFNKALAKWAGKKEKNFEDYLFESIS